MQIHELNNFTGTLGSGAYLAIDDGTDTGKISSQGLLAATEARIDNIIAGPAPSAEEIVDARLGADGVTYPSLGDAIRNQFTDVKSAIDDIVTTNYLFRTKSATVSGSGAYVYKDILTITDVDADGYTMSVGNITNATATIPCFIKQYDSSNNLIKTSNLTANHSIYIKPESATVKMLFQLYPAVGTPLTNPAVYNDVVVYKGKQIIIELNSDVIIDQLDIDTNDIAKLNKSLIDSDNIRYFSVADVVNQYNNQSGNDTYIYRAVYEDSNITGLRYMYFSIGSVTGATASHYANVYFFDSNNTQLDVQYLGGGNAPLTRVLTVPQGAAKVRLVLYPSTTGIVTATYSNIIVCAGEEPLILLSQYVKTIREAYKDIPSYYFANNYLDNKVSAINTEIEKCAANGDAFIFTTDQHWPLNAKKSPALIRYIKNNTNISKLFNGGDTADKGSFDFMAQLKDNFDKNIYSIVGNHDFMGWHSEDYVAYLFDDYSKDQLVGYPSKNFYYLDNNKQKIRYVVLEAYRPLENSEGQYESHLGYTQAQIDWLSNVALDVSAGWGIVILTHVLYGINTATDAIGAVDIDVVDAIDNYSGDGEILCIIQGHTHRDRITHTPSGIPVIITTCDKYQPYLDGGIPDINTTRTAGTITEQAFDVFVINRNDELITAIRIGAPALDGVDGDAGSQVEYRQIPFRE